MEERRSVRLKCKKGPTTEPLILSNESCQSPSLPQPPSLPPPLISPTPKRKKTKSETNRDYRQKLLADPEKAAKYRETCRQNSRIYRASATADRKEHMKEASRISMVKVRAKQKLSESNSKPKTRSEEEEKKLATAKATEAKRKWRANRTQQKKVWDNAKRKEKRAQQKLEKAAAQRGTVSTQTLSSPTSSQVSSLSFAPEPSPTAPEKVDTPAAKRQRLSRARRAMPKDPEKFVDTYSTLRATATPKKKAVFERRELAASTSAFDVGAAVGKKLKSIKGKNDAHSREIRKIILSLYKKCGSLSKASAVLHMDRKTIVNHLKPKVNMRKKKSQEMKTKIRDFFAREAAPLPDKKLVNKKTGEAASILQKRVEDYYRQYQEEASIAATPSMSQFAKCRPKYVRKMSHTRLNQCLCEYCSNCDLKIKALNRLAAQHNKIRHVYHAVALSTCDSGNKTCAYRQCADCDISKLDDFLEPLKSHVGQLSWCRWTTKKVRSGGKEVPRKVLETRHGSSTDLIQEFLSETAFLSEHLFRASWQHRQFMKLYKQRPFPEGLLLMVLDFAENFTCFFQHEVQAAHWHHNQVTVHPVATYYSCPNCMDGMVNESVIFVSDDLKHDHHAVHAFAVRAVQHMRQTRHLQFDHIVQWSDGCGAQYKSKGPFADVAASHRDFGVPVSRCYFGSRHGKGPCDGEATVVKQNVTSAVKTGRAVIGSAADFFKYCQDSTLAKQPTDGACHHFVRSFFWVPSNEINRQGKNGQ